MRLVGVGARDQLAQVNSGLITTTKCNGIRIQCLAICKDLHQIVNGDIIFNPDTTPRAEGATAVYSCVSGYKLSGVNIRTCVNGTSGMGVWTGSIPSCRGMKTCEYQSPCIPF